MKKNLKKLVNKFKITLFHIIPLHFISNITYKVSRIEDTTIKNILINMYIYIFNIKLNEYKQKNIRNYKNLNDFFTRELDLSFRNKIDKSDNIISPCDGTISGFGEINKNTFVHAKKHNYSICELTHEEKNDFNNGRYINIYLEPKDCHRVYMPCDAYLIKVTHIPGSLYSVAPYASEGIKKLYSKNERVILFFSNDKFKMSLILIGAVNVGCISLTEQGIIAPSKHRNIITEFNNKKNIKKYKKGDEVGMFNLGSTVIILLSEQICQWSENIKIKKKILIRDEIIKKS